MRLSAVMCQQSIVVAPVDTVARVNSRAFFNCSVSTGGDFVMWEYQPPRPDASVRIYTEKENKVKDDQKAKFEVERNNQTGAHNLVIKSVQMDLAVLYFCGLVFDGMKKTAHLVAISMIRNFMPVNLWNYYL